MALLPDLTDQGIFGADVPSFNQCAGRTPHATPDKEFTLGAFRVFRQPGALVLVQYDSV
jgi:hypothetical protein